MCQEITSYKNTIAQSFFRTWNNHSDHKLLGNSSLRFKLSCKKYLHSRFVSLHCNERRPNDRTRELPSNRFVQQWPQKRSRHIPLLLSQITADVNSFQQFSSQKKTAQFHAYSTEGVNRNALNPKLKFCELNISEFPRSLFQSEPKCEIFVMVISSNFNMNKTWYS